MLIQLCLTGSISDVHGVKGKKKKSILLLFSCEKGVIVKSGDGGVADGSRGRGEG